MEELTNIMLVTEDGEFKGYLSEKEVKQLDKMRTSAPRTNEVAWDKIEELNERSDFQQYVKDNFGEFFFNFYKRNKKKEFLFRFLYLCTYMNYRNYLEFGEAKDESRLIKRKDLKEMLNLADQQYYDTINYFFDNEMLVEDEDKYILVNDVYCKKGKIKSKIKLKGSVKVFSNAIQELYNKANSKEHKRLGVLITVLPYIHFDMNIVCFNPKEEHTELIKPMTVEDISSLCGYKNVRSFKNAVKNITVDGNYALSRMTISNMECIVVNPNIFYKGNGMKIQWLKNFFEMAQKSL